MEDILFDIPQTIAAFIVAPNHYVVQTNQAVIVTGGMDDPSGVAGE